MILHARDHRESGNPAAHRPGSNGRDERESGQEPGGGRRELVGDIDLDVEPAIEAAGDADIEAPEAAVAVGRAEEHISDRIGITSARLR